MKSKTINATVTMEGNAVRLVLTGSPDIIWAARPHDYLPPGAGPVIMELSASYSFRPRPWWNPMRWVRGRYADEVVRRQFLAHFAESTEVLP